MRRYSAAVSTAAAETLDSACVKCSAKRRATSFGGKDTWTESESEETDSESLISIANC